MTHCVSILLVESSSMLIKVNDIQVIPKVITTINLKNEINSIWLTQLYIELKTQECKSLNDLFIF